MNVGSCKTCKDLKDTENTIAFEPRPLEETEKSIPF